MSSYEYSRGGSGGLSGDTHSSSGGRRREGSHGSQWNPRRYYPPSSYHSRRHQYGYSYQSNSNPNSVNSHGLQDTRRPSSRGSKLDSRHSVRDERPRINEDIRSGPSSGKSEYWPEPRSRSSYGRRRRTESDYHWASARSSSSPSLRNREDTTKPKTTTSESSHKKSLSVSKPPVKSNGTGSEKEAMPTGVEIKKESDIEPIWSDDEMQQADGCIFPMLRPQQRVWEIRCKSKKERRKNLKHFSPGHIESLDQYNFTDTNLTLFRQVEVRKLISVLAKLKGIIDAKKGNLMEEYLSRNRLWQDRNAVMDEHVKIIDKLEEDIKKSKEDKKDEKKNKKKERARLAREKARKEEEEKRKRAEKARHHGDAVRTEAEFMEILESLQRERDKDPLARAQYGAAVIPDMSLDPIKSRAHERFVDTNNRVTDKEAWANRIKTDMVDTFTEAEQAKFAKGFTMYPKKFGRISHYMGGLRSPEACVLHYYVTKKKMDYKHSSGSKGKKGKHGKSRRKERGRRKSRERSRSKEGRHGSETSAGQTSFGSSNDDTRRQLHGQMLQSHGFYESPTSSRVETSEDASSAVKTEGSEAEDSLLKHSALVSNDNNGKGSNDTTLETDNDAATESDSEAATVPGSDTEGNPVYDSRGVVASTPVYSPRVANSIARDKAAIEQHRTEGTIESVAAALLVSKKAAPSESITIPKRGRRGRKRTRDISSETHREVKRERKASKHATSYWSVQETEQFPTLLRQYGTNWDVIATTLGSKTASMVRNYYQRGLKVNPGWKQLTLNADVHPIQPVSIPDPNQILQPAFRPSTDIATSYSVHSGPVKAGAMSMSNLLNPGSAKSNPSNFVKSTDHKPTIMSLLNNDGSETTGIRTFGSSLKNQGSTTVLPPIQPSYRNIMNNPLSSNPSIPVRRKPFDPVAEAGKDIIATKTSQQQKPQNSDRSSNGLSALDALAEVAFERK